MIEYRGYTTAKQSKEPTLTKISQKTPKICGDFELEEIDGEVLLYSPKATRSIYLNPSASIIWQLCTGDHTVVEIIALLQQQFPDDAVSIEQDVFTTIEQFSEFEAIELS